MNGIKSKSALGILFENRLQIVCKLPFQFTKCMVRLPLINQYVQRETEIFNLLKQKIVLKMQQSYPGLNPDMRAWKVQDIVDFQEELLKKVNARISEKWFYNHFKTSADTLPRIDTLNLLSKYAGYSNWDDFKFKNSQSVAKPLVHPTNANRYFVLIPVLVILVLVIFYFAFKIISTRDYRIVFVDADTQQPITSTVIEVSLIKEGVPQSNQLCKSDGSFLFSTDKSIVSFVVKSPHYHTDTLTIVLDKVNRKEIVALKPDSFSTMLDYFSTINVKDWQKQRNQLDQSVADNAVICQVFDSDEHKVDTLNKWEFINRLTRLPGSHQDIRILEKKYEGEKISFIRFKQTEAKRKK